MHGIGQNESHWQKPINHLRTAAIHLVMARSVPRATDVVGARHPNEAILSHGGAAQARGPVNNCGIVYVYVICE